MSSKREQAADSRQFVKEFVGDPPEADVVKEVKRGWSWQARVIGVLGLVAMLAALGKVGWNYVSERTLVGVEAMLCESGGECVRMKDVVVNVQAGETRLEMMETGHGVGSLIWLDGAKPAEISAEVMPGFEEIGGGGGSCGSAVEGPSWIDNLGEIMEGDVPEDGRKVAWCEEGEEGVPACLGEIARVEGPWSVVLPWTVGFEARYAECEEVVQ